MTDKPDDICPRPTLASSPSTRPHASPIYLASVYECDDPQQADDLLAGRQPGYIYSRDGHPNADVLAETCGKLHGAQRAAITSSGMSAMALALLSQLQQGDHVVVSNRLYGRSSGLLTAETARLGIASSVVDTCDLDATAEAIRPDTKLLVVETITNPLLRVSDIGGLAELAHESGALLLVDNTFASPAVCRPIDLGADLVLESLTKIMNGHSDVLLGMLCGSEAHWGRIDEVISAWGLTSSPMDCYLASRGLATMHLRVGRASDNALAVARFLADFPGVEQVIYPGLPEHPDHALAQRQFTDWFGSIVAFTLPGGTSAAEQFIAAARQIAFCPSLGELSTTLSHPASTSHRRMTPEQQAELGIFGGTIRLSVGIESPDFVIESLKEGLAGVGGRT